MLKNKTILSKLAQEGPRLIPKRKCFIIIIIIIQFIKFINKNIFVNINIFVYTCKFILDINPQLLLIHVKQPKELSLDTKKQIKKKTSKNILQYTTPDNTKNHEIKDEEELNVFQNNNGKHFSFFIGILNY